MTEQHLNEMKAFFAKWERRRLDYVNGHDKIDPRVVGQLDGYFQLVVTALRDVVNVARDPQAGFHKEGGALQEAETLLAQLPPPPDKDALPANGPQFPKDRKPTPPYQSQV